MLLCMRTLFIGLMAWKKQKGNRTSLDKRIDSLYNKNKTFYCKGVNYERKKIHRSTNSVGNHSPYTDIDYCVFYRRYFQVYLLIEGSYLASKRLILASTSSILVSKSSKLDSKFLKPGCNQFLQGKQMALLNAFRGVSGCFQ